MERIRNSGNSEALLALAKRISDTMKQRSSQPLSMNLSPNTVVDRASPGVSRMKLPILRNYSSDGYYSLQEKIGRCSFKNYSVCEIENVGSLEVIEMGESKRDSYTFFYTASLRLKSDCSVLRVMNRLTEFEITSIW